MAKEKFPWENPGWALITGASAGIGMEFARQLAQMRFSLVLVARREDRLRSLAANLEQEYRITTEFLSADLAQDDGIAAVVARIKNEPNLDVLVNNAGFGSVGTFATANFDHQIEMLRVHNLAPVHLCRAALPGMISRGRGAIINVASLASYLPAAGSVMYSATKAFLRMLSESIALELEGTGVVIQALCPGFTHTEFHEAGELEGTGEMPIPKGMWMSVDSVVKDSLKGVKDGKVVVVPGLKNRVFRSLIKSSIFGGIAKNMTKKTFLKRQYLTSESH
jgi:hypothetical protein